METCNLGNIQLPAEGTCVHTSGDGGLLLIGSILEPGKVTENGSIFVDENGIIQCVGCGCLTQHSNAETITCNGASISPGLINTHDHMGWMGGEPYVASEAGDDPLLRWEHRHDWRKGKRGHPKISQDKGEHQGAKSQRWGEMRFALGGSTSINGSGSVDGFLRNLDRGNALEGLNVDAVEYETFPLGDSGGSMHAEGCDYSLPNASDLASESAFTPHVSEGIDIEARNEFLCLSTDAHGGVDALNANTAIIHGIGVNASDVQLMAADGMVATIKYFAVWRYGARHFVSPLGRTHRTGNGLGSFWFYEHQPGIGLCYLLKRAALRWLFFLPRSMDDGHAQRCESHEHGCPHRHPQCR